MSFALLQTSTIFTIQKIILQAHLVKCLFLDKMDSI